MIGNIESGKDVIVTIGSYAPIIESLIVFYCLMNQRPYLHGYLVFLIVNFFINYILKMTIREPRPMNGNNPENYGMPSKHAQTLFFSITFLYLVKQDLLFLILGLFLAVLTIYQRFTYYRHTIEQLFVGSLIGTVVGYVSFLITKRYIHTLF
jgi:hypothetical protein